jgi:5-methylcytosine-specific restriction endonuclease McrBC regulatory subunit McrC
MGIRKNLRSQKKVLTNGFCFDILSERLMRSTENGLSMSESVEKAEESA